MTGIFTVTALLNEQKHSRLCSLFGWCAQPKMAAESGTPVSDLTTPEGVRTAYMHSEHRKSALWLNGQILLRSALNAAANVGIVQSTANIAGHAFSKSNSQKFLWPGIELAICAIALLGSKFYQSKAKSKLEIDMSSWLSDKFMRAVLKHPDTVHRLTQLTTQKDKKKNALPDSAHIRLALDPQQYVHDLFNVREIVINTSLTGAITGLALFQNLLPVEKLSQIVTSTPREYLGLALTTAMIAGYAGIMKIQSSALTRIYAEAQTDVRDVEGTISKQWSQVFANGEAIAAERGHTSAQNSIGNTIQKQKGVLTIRDKWHRVISLFQNANNLIGTQLIPVLSAVGATFSQPSGPLKMAAFIATYRLAAAFMGAQSQYNESLAARIAVGVLEKRLAEMAELVEIIKDKKAYYSHYGIHDFEYETKDMGDVALRISNLKLMHKGQKSEFLKTKDNHALVINKGDFIRIQGKHESGKTTLLEAIDGWWGYGEGKIETSSENRVFIRQGFGLTADYTLAEHLMNGTGRQLGIQIDDADRDTMITALKKAGLEKYKDDLDQTGVNGSDWNSVFSGGQKHKFSLAMLLCRTPKPDLILLDEPLNGLDLAARKEFLDTIKREFPDAAKILINHYHSEDDKRADVNNGYFNKEINIEGGIITIKDLKPTPSNPYGHDIYGPS